MKGTSAARMSLTWKFFFLTAFIISLLIAVTLAFSSRKATALANETIREGLKDTLSVFDNFQRDRYAKLQMSNALIAHLEFCVTVALKIIENRQCIFKAFADRFVRKT